MAHFLDIAGFENKNYDIQHASLAGLNNFSSLDITDVESIEQLDPDIDFVFLFAGITGTQLGFRDYADYIKINEIGLINLLSWMVKTKCRARVVFPSSRLVYKGKSNFKLKEDDPKEPKTIYAINKLTAESLLCIYYNAFGINYTIFRVCIPYGSLFDNDYSYGTIGFLLNKAKNKEPIVLYGDGLQRRTFTHVEDLCHVIISSVNLEATNNQIYNIGGEDLSLLNVAQLIAKKYDVQIVHQEWPEMALKLESGDTVFDDSKLNAEGLALYQHKVSGLFSV